MNTPLQIDYYTDILCVWAWIAQRRIDAIENKQGEKISLHHHCINVFGDTASRIGEGWADRGGFAGFAEHVAESAAPYKFAPINPAIWRDVRPYTSATAHLVLKAAELITTPDHAMNLSLKFRQLFFVDAVDIGDRRVVLDSAREAGFDIADLNTAIDSGRAMAMLVSDYEEAKKLGLKGSPSIVMNDGRQVLYGNVGYRIINANVRELLKRPVSEASWC
jgi:predicted DsbA family dithiol-disulfide isomerase